MKFKRNLYIEDAQLDMVPLINCVFLLLIFFLLTSSFISQPGIKISLPKAVTSEVIQENTVVITITSDNRFYLNETPVTLLELKSKLEKTSTVEPVLIKADRDVILSKVVNIWDFCRDLGIKQVNIATNQE
ncbi:MAG: biopolymer transporter ExbD [Candidatus Omnitrophota bacterium]|jgi:biopolymer transport protein ExbD|nr:biopolymer transporter ExbD [Candidatus Omnitrophota bacterium]